MAANTTNLQNGDGWTHLRNLELLENLQVDGVTFDSVQTATTAHAGGGQTNATQLSATLNNVTVAATAADSVKLLPSALGLTQTVTNNGANAIQIFGTSPDTINGVATGTGISLPAGATAKFTVYALGNWVEGLGNQPDFQTVAVAGQSNIVATLVSDTLTIAAGSGVTLTTNAGTKTLTIASSAAAGTLPAFIARTDATALTAANITSNISGGLGSRYTLSSATGVPITLPLATGTGNVLEFRILTKSTSNGYVFDFGVSPGSNTFKSALLGHPTLAPSAVTNVNVTTAGNHNRMTLLNGQAGTGGDVGDYIKFTDAVTGQWHVEGVITVDTTTATFSSY